MELLNEGKRFYVDLKLWKLLDFQAEGLGLDEGPARAYLQSLDIHGWSFDYPEKGTIRYLPEQWSHFLADQGDTLPLPADTYETQVIVLEAWDDWLCRWLVGLVRAGKVSYENLRRDWGWLFECPYLQAALAQDFRLGVISASRKKPGPEPKLNPDLLNLYGWASHIYFTNPELSLDLACTQAIEDHPELIPESWHPPENSEDPEFHLGRRLKQEMMRIEKKFPQYDQKSYRHRRSN